MKHIKTFKEVAKIGSLSAILALGLAACGSANNTDENSANSSQSIAKKGATVFIEKNLDGSYKIVDELPSNQTRVFLRELDENGTMQERLLSQDELSTLMREANAKIDAGQSALTNSSLSSSSMSLGETILASAAGAIIGSWIGSKLFGSPGYLNQRQTAYKTPSAYARSADSFRQNSAANSAKSTGRSGFFGGGAKTANTSSYGG